MGNIKVSIKRYFILYMGWILLYPRFSFVYSWKEKIKTKYRLLGYILAWDFSVVSPETAY